MWNAVENLDYLEQTVRPKRLRTYTREDQNTDGPVALIDKLI